MRKFLMLIAPATLAAVAALSLLVASPAVAKTDVYRLVDDPFQWYQCYNLGDFIEGPADYFGQAVCVEYRALNSVTTRIKLNKDGTEDVGWTLIQDGSATINAWTNAPAGATPGNGAGFNSNATLGAILYTGPFHVEEVGQDDLDDSGCVATASDGVTPVAFLGTCEGLLATVEFIRYHWKITGNKVYFFELRVTDPGAFCYLDDRGVIFDGGGCPGP